jgi:hypothetical protein
MTALTGIFATLPGIENIPPEGVQKWVKNRLGDHAIENYVANRITYPQTIAISPEEKQIDQAIIQEYIARNPALFYNPLTHKLNIPQGITHYIQPVQDLMLILSSLLKLSQITPVFISDGSSVKVEGSIIVPNPPSSEPKINVSFNGKMQTLEKSRFYHFPIADQHIKFKIGNENEILISGGTLGVSLDLRIRGT